MKVRDGWHTIYGREVYVEYGYITRGMRKDRNGSSVPAGVFRADRKYGGWSREYKITLPAFKAGVARGTVDLF